MKIKKQIDDLLLESGIDGYSKTYMNPYSGGVNIGCNWASDAVLGCWAVEGRNLIWPDDKEEILNRLKSFVEVELFKGEWVKV